MTNLLVLLYVSLLVCLMGTAVAAFWLGSVPAITNSLVATALASTPLVVPALLGPSSAPVLDAAPALAVWLSAAGLLHTIGMFGPYDSVWWWDHCTHTLSAALLAAVIYAILVVTDPTIALVGSGPVVWIGGTVLCTLALGVVWEFLELLAREIGDREGIDPVLEYYGLRDTVADLAFDVVGAVLVIALDLRVFVSVIERDPAIAKAALALTVATGFLVVGAITVWLERGRRRAVR